ncbi:unnamed protein product [Lactuca saligna]|uniref:Uncharacterized protein n=1 Tax=Lactuca saligna TaxID=75948 RepID=A0AA36ED42_LACSI|nr:unnamed protein product [Lactuca saligna]
MNKHIQFSSTSTSTPSADDNEECGSTLLVVKTIDPMIEDESASHSPQAGTGPPIPTTINIVAFRQDDQEESRSNYKTNVLSKPSLVMQLTQSLGKRLNKVDKDGADMKRFMDFIVVVVDDDMVVDGTPPSSPGDNPPPRSPPSSNIPPTPPPLSHPHPLTPS